MFKAIVTGVGCITGFVSQFVCHNEGREGWLTLIITLHSCDVSYVRKRNTHTLTLVRIHMHTHYRTNHKFTSLTFIRPLNLQGYLWNRIAPVPPSSHPTKRTSHKGLLREKWGETTQASANFVTLWRVNKYKPNFQNIEKLFFWALLFLLAATANGALPNPFPNQYKLLDPLSLSLFFAFYGSLSHIHCNAAQSTLHMVSTKAGCTLVDLGLWAFVAKVCDITNSFHCMDTYTHAPAGKQRWML